MRAIDDGAPEFWADDVDIDGLEIAGSNVRIPFVKIEGGELRVAFWVRRPIESCKGSWLDTVRAAKAEQLARHRLELFGAMN